MFKSHQEGQRCRICFRRLINHQRFLEVLLGEDLLCSDCRDQLKAEPRTVCVLGEPVFSLYRYEGVQRQWFLQYKEGHDKALAPIFLSKHKRLLRKICKDRAVVLVPSHENAVKNRGFAVMEEMLKGVVSEPVHVFRKTRDVYQKELNRVERFENRQNFEADFSGLFMGQKIILMDDLMTTGATLINLYKTLAERGYKVSLFTVYRHKSLE